MISSKKKLHENYFYASFWTLKRFHKYGKGVQGSISATENRKTA